MKKVSIITIIILLLILIITILITNIIYNTNKENTNYSYDCCYDGMSEEEKNMILVQLPCSCSDDINMFEKTLIVLGIKKK